MGIDEPTLRAFVRESNAIEGITRDPTIEELAIHWAFLRNRHPDVHALEAFVAVVQPRAVLRDQVGLDVIVGAHLPPPGGPAIRPRVRDLIAAATIPGTSPYAVHVSYETLHPFTDGNGRSGRVLWLWQMIGQGYGGERGFLHQWYYQSWQATCAGA